MGRDQRAKRFLREVQYRSLQAPGDKNSEPKQMLGGVVFAREGIRFMQEQGLYTPSPTP